MKKRTIYPAMASIIETGIFSFYLGFNIETTGTEVLNSSRT